MIDNDDLQKTLCDSFLLGGMSETKSMYYATVLVDNILASDMEDRIVLNDTLGRVADALSMLVK